MKLQLYILTTIAMLLCDGAYAQIDTVYYTEAAKKTVRDSATHYVVKVQLDAKTIKKERYTVAGQLQSTITYKRIDTTETPDGPFTSYYDNDQVHASGYHKEGLLDGEFKSYYENGRIKRIARYDNGKLAEGKMYDIKGKHIFFTEYQKMAQVGYDLYGFIEANIRYPRKALNRRIAGKVIVQFVVAETGEITHPQVINSIYPTLDAEALRVVKLLPKWTPAMQDDKPVKMYFTLPLIFRVHDW